MESTSKSYALFLVCMLFVSSATPIIGCNVCGKPPPKKHRSPKGPITVPPIVNPPINLPPVVQPPITVPPVTVPKTPVPPVTVPKIPVPPVTVPKIPVPPVTVPKIPVPPVTVPKIPVPTVPLPPVTVPPVIGGKPPAGSPCPPSGKETCPIDTLKLGGCVDLLGGLVHIGLGDPAANECCPVIQGLAEIEAAVCLCTTLKIKALNLNIYVPLALQLLMTCGKSPPPGYTCSL